MINDELLTLGAALMSEINRKIENSADNNKSNYILNLPSKLLQLPIEKIEESLNPEFIPPPSPSRPPPVALPRNHIQNMSKIQKSKRQPKQDDEMSSSSSTTTLPDIPHNMRANPKYNMESSRSSSSSSRSSNVGTKKLPHKGKAVTGCYTKAMEDVEFGLDKCLMPKFKENVIICNSKHVNMKYKDNGATESIDTNFKSFKYKLFLISYIIVIFVIIGFIIYTILN